MFSNAANNCYFCKSMKPLFNNYVIGIGSILNGKTIPEAHNTAVRVSAYVCTREGAMPEIPDSLK